MKIILLFFLSAFLLSGCLDCGPQKELTIRLTMNADSFLLKRVTAPQAIDLSIFDEQLKNYPSQSYAQSRDFTFPISLNADSTTYIFEFESRTDTLTLFYTREFSYKDGCGFVVDAKRPNSLFETKSTFKYVYVNYESYILDEKVSLFGPYEGDGISVEASL